MSRIPGLKNEPGMVTDVRIDPMWRHPDLLPLFASLYEREWPDWYGPHGPGNAAKALRAACTRDGLPAGLFALIDGMHAGTVILGNDSAAGASFPGPWVSSLYVLPEWRGRGVASRLIAAAETVGAALGFREVYIGVTDLEAAVLGRGYVLVDRVTHGLSDVAILRKLLG